MKSTTVIVNGIERQVTIDADGLFRIDDASGSAAIAKAADGSYSVIIDGAQHTVTVGSSGNGTYEVASRGGTFEVKIVDPRRLARGGAGLAADGPQTIVAPMPGKVVEVKVTVGDVVNKGDGVVVVEAMKMQNALKTAKDGTVVSVNVSAGDSVAPGNPLVVID